MAYEENGTARVEAFSDGVFAVAITLLALDIHVPEVDPLHPAALAPKLLMQWPRYLAYVTSFLSILVMWINHDRLFEHIGKKDRGLVLLNGLLLMVITLYPFPTSLVAEYIQHRGAKIAVAVYAAFSIVMAILFNRLWRHAADGERLLTADHDRHKGGASLSSTGSGLSCTRLLLSLPLLAPSSASAFRSPWLCFLLCRKNPREK